jgi:hypothetical protein
LRAYQNEADGKWVVDITKPDGLATERKDFSWDPGAQIRGWGAYGGVRSIWNTNPGLQDDFVDFGFLKGNFIGTASVTWNGFSTLPWRDRGLRVEPESNPKRPGILRKDAYIYPLPLYKLDFKDCVAVGRLEIDGFVADAQTGASTLSTRDKFPLVRVNCEEELREKPAPQEKEGSPGEEDTSGKKDLEVYEVTVGEAAIAELTFRAQPGEWVLAAVGVADKDGNTTDEAWVTFDADERFERKKDKPKEVFLVKKDGTKVPAKRLIATKLVVPDNAQWCASKKVYIHCLKANAKPYDYKVVVWGQERYSKTETGKVHHDQSLRRWWTNKLTGEEKAEPIEKWLEDPWIPRVFRWYVTDQERFNAVKLDLDVDSDNTKGFDPPDRNWAEESIEDDEGKPGKYVAINDFDRDGDGIPGFADGFDADGVLGNDDDTPDGAQFVPVVMAMSQNVNLDTAKIRITYSNSDPFQVAQNGQVWEPAQGALRLWLVDGIIQRNPIPIDVFGDYVPPGIYPANLFAWVEDNPKAERTVTLYLEGIELSKALGDQRITLELSPEGEEDNAAFELLDAVRVTVIGVDLDVDSNNDGVISNPNPNAEDQSEDIKDKPEFPGKYVGVNDGDVDNDGVPNWADGFQSKDVDNSGDKAGGSFTEMILSVPEPVDLAMAKLRFTYSASDPFQVGRAGAGTPADPFVYTPAPGYLRVWTKDGNVSRNAKSIAEPGGNFVASNTTYTAAQLGLAPATRTVTLYIEGIRPSDSVADQQIKVELDPDGDGPASWVHEDAVRVTIIQVDLDVDSDNTKGFEDPDENSFEDAIEDRTDLPGKIIRANTGDINLNFTKNSGAVPNWADGIDKLYPSSNGLPAVNNNNVDASPNFVRMFLKISGAVDVAKAKFKFTYSASDPDNLVRVVVARPAADWVYPEVVSYTLPAGNLRIWTEDGPKVRKATKITDTPAGNFVPTSVDIPAADLGFTNTTQLVKIFVECVRPSATLADLPIKVELIPDGSGFKVEDQVRVMGIDLKYEEHPTENKYGFDPTEGIVDLMSLVRKTDPEPPPPPPPSLHRGDVFPQPNLPGDTNPGVKARQVSVAYEAAAANGKKTKIAVTLVPNIEAVMQKIRFKSKVPAKVKFGSDPQSPTKVAGRWELEVEGVDRYEDLDNQAVYGYIDTDATANKYVFKELSVYAFQEAKLTYRYFRVEDSASAGTAVAKKSSTLTTATPGGDATMVVASVANFKVGDCILKDNTEYGKIIGIDVATKTLTLSANVPAMAIGDTVYTFTQSSADLTNLAGRTYGVLKKGVMKFDLTRIDNTAVNIAYDGHGVGARNGVLDYGGTEAAFVAERDEILNNLPGGPFAYTDPVIIRIHGNMNGTNFAYIGGMICLTDTANDFTAAHEGLHTKTVMHQRDSDNDVMWWRAKDPKEDFLNTQYRSSGNGNILRTDATGKQIIERGWTQVSPRP